MTVSAKQAALLVKIVAAHSTQPGYLFVKPSDVSGLVAAGQVEVNPGLPNPADAKQFACRATSYGVNAVEAANGKHDAAKHDNHAAADDKPAATTVDKPADVVQVAPTASTNNARKITVADFEIESGIELPAAATAKRGGARPDLYPFAKLEVGQSFFVPASEAKPEPWKSMTSTVNQATARHATDHPTETRKNRKGETVPVSVKTKVFTLVKGEKGGVQGARVFRTA